VARVALEDERRSIGVDELAELVHAEAVWLLAQAPGARGDHGGERAPRFALLAGNGCSWAIADLALHAQRLLNVPVPPHFTPAQVTHVLDDAGIDVVLTDDPGRVVSGRPDFHVLGPSPQTGLWALRRKLDAATRAVPHAGTSKITYTSGSTAAPKGVCLSAVAMERVAQSLAEVTGALGITRHLCLLPLATLLDNLAGLLAAPLAGAGCALPSAQTTGVSYAGVDLPRLLACITRFEPGSMILVPELLRLLLAGVAHGWRPPRSLRFIAVGGAHVSPQLLQRAASLGLPVFEGYGLSECASVVTLNTPDARRAGTAGRPLPHASVRVDARGHVLVRGATMLGYLGEPALPAGGIAAPEFDTGDLGAIDADGFLQIRGRAGNRMITSLGRNLSPEWIESELCAEPSIAQVAVFGDARPHPVALVVPTRVGALLAELPTAMAVANARLPVYARVQRWALLDAPFSHADGTLTANGRLRRAVIAERHGALIESLYADALAS
jgi:long-subunit acyl-CoA synthetase (AMP-forming)